LRLPYRLRSSLFRHWTEINKGPLVDADLTDAELMEVQMNDANFGGTVCPDGIEKDEAPC
jgi:hypothetical protein